MTWVLIAVNVAFVLWLVAALGYSDPCDVRGAPPARCADARVGSAGMGAMMIVGLWALADLVLGGAWLITRSRAEGE